MSRVPAAIAVLACLAGTLGCQSAPSQPVPDAEAARTRALLARGDERAGAAESESALRIYKTAIERNPANVRSHLRYVGQMLELGRRSEVRDEYLARAARAGASDAERTMSERLTTNGSSSALRRVYTNAASRSTASPWWHLALVEVETAEADAWNQLRLEAAVRGDRDAETDAQAQALGALGRAQVALDRAGERAPRLAEVELYRGYLRATEGDIQPGSAGQTAAYAAAAEAFADATRLAPNLVEAWAGLGDARFRIGDLRASLGAFIEAVRREPANAEYRESLGVVLHEADRYLEAVDQYREAARLRPWDPTPFVKMGDAFADAERWQAAIDAYDDALRRDPTLAVAHYKSGVVLEHVGRTREARVAFERYVQFDGPRSSSVKRRIDRLLSEERR